MKQPHSGFKLPDFSGQTKFLFASEGNPIAMLVSNRTTKPKRFANPAAALEWCRKHAVAFIHFPATPIANPAAN